MKILKKITAIAAAASMAVGMSSVSLFAEDAYSLHIDSEGASVGETVSVNVVIDAGSTGIGAIAFKLNYDPLELELVSAKPGEDLRGWITGDVDSEGNNSLNLSESGTIGFGYATMGSGFSGKSVTLINASFNVLKPNAGFTLTEVVIAASDMDGTDITEQGSIDDSSVVECSHQNTRETVTEATCRDEGRREVTCTDCGELVRTETIAKTGNHTWNSGTVTTEPTCTEKGVKTFTCSVCNETKTEEIAALGHSWNDGEITAEPTCTEKGTKTFTCSVCNETKTEEIAALGHDWGEWMVTKEATTAEEGEETRECKTCGEKETRAIAKLPPEAPVVTAPALASGEFHVPETTAASAAVSESAGTTAAPANNQTTDAVSTTTTAAAVTAAPSDNTPNTSANTEGSVSNTYDTAAAENTGNAVNVGNAGSSNTDGGKNVPTGILISVIPAAAAAAGIILSKKRK